jgi:hypothetical protein
VRRMHNVLSVAHVLGNGYALEELQAMAYGGGRCFQDGCAQPTDDVADS